jgi:hypothetical protein
MSTSESWQGAPMDYVALARVSPEFVENWARLRGVKRPTTPFEVLIDQSTGYSAAGAELFAADVQDIFQRLEAAHVVPA